jgi:hypothetical protein
MTLVRVMSPSTNESPTSIAQIYRGCGMTARAKATLSGWYNGFSPQERDRAARKQRLAFASGEVARRTICVACGREESETSIVPHLEDYRRPLDFVALCARCHHWVHARQRDRKGWNGYRKWVRGARDSTVLDEIEDRALGGRVAGQPSTGTRRQKAHRCGRR